MHITIKWNEKTSEGEITKESLKNIADNISIDGKFPITVLDFLQDSAGLITAKYNETLNNYHESCKK